VIVEIGGAAPKIDERTTMSTYDMAQTAELLEVARGTRLLVPVILGVLCGLRRGEIVALRWQQVDLPTPSLQWSRAPSRPVRAKVASEHLGHSKVGSRSTSTRMSSPACRPMPRPALTRPFE
jgi:hypothetical protein